MGNKQKNVYKKYPFFTHIKKGGLISFFYMCLLGYVFRIYGKKDECLDNNF